MSANPTPEQIQEALSCADLGGDCGSSWHCEALAAAYRSLQSDLEAERGKVALLESVVRAICSRTILSKSEGVD